MTPFNKRGCDCLRVLCNDVSREKKRAIVKIKLRTRVLPWLQRPKRYYSGHGNHLRAKYFSLTWHTCPPPPLLSFPRYVGTDTHDDEIFAFPLNGNFVSFYSTNLPWRHDVVVLDCCRRLLRTNL